MQVERARAKELPSGVATVKRVQNRDLRTQLKSLGEGLLGRALSDSEVLAQAEEYAERHVLELAREVGDGVCPAQAGAIANSAALNLAASRYFWSLFWGDEGTMEARNPEIAATATKMADSHRQHTLAAYEVTARMAKNRREAAKRGEKSGGLAKALKKGLVERQKEKTDE